LNPERRASEQGGQIDPQPLVVQNIGVLIGSPSLIAGKLPLTFGGKLAVIFRHEWLAS